MKGKFYKTIDANKTGQNRAWRELVEKHIVILNKQSENDLSLPFYEVTNIGKNHRCVLKENGKIIASGVKAITEKIKYLRGIKYLYEKTSDTN